MAKRKNYTVYVLDDDEPFCQQIAELLEEVCNVEYFTNPVHLLEKIEFPYPDLLMLDLNLNHRLSGLDVLAKVKKKQDSHLLPVIMISGADDSAILQKAFKSGIEDYIIKPFSPIYFIHKVENLIYGSKKKIHLQALTGLPGNYMIEEKYNFFQNGKKRFCVAYIDLDNFKPFNDVKGVKAGDKAIKLLADILKKEREYYDPQKLFVGHLGGDDFFIIALATKDVKKVVNQVYEQWQFKSALFFSEKERAQGYYTSKSRSGQKEQYRFLTLSTAILTISPNLSRDYMQLTEMAAQVKKTAKTIDGNSISVKSW